jgi:hypothetical protein
MPGWSRRDGLAEQRHALAEQGQLAGVKESGEQVAPAGRPLVGMLGMRVLPRPRYGGRPFSRTSSV